MKLNDEAIVAMAIAAIAEESGADIKNIRVRSFRKIGKSALEEYIEERGITYKKYQLGD